MALDRVSLEALLAQREKELRLKLERRKVHEEQLAKAKDDLGTAKSQLVEALRRLPEAVAADQRAAMRRK